MTECMSMYCMCTVPAEARKGQWISVTSVFKPPDADAGN